MRTTKKDREEIVIEQNGIRYIAHSNSELAGIIRRILRTPGQKVLVEKHQSGFLAKYVKKIAQLSREKAQLEKRIDDVIESMRTQILMSYKKKTTTIDKVAEYFHHIENILKG